MTGDCDYEIRNAIERELDAALDRLRKEDEREEVFHSYWSDMVAGEIEHVVSAILRQRSDA